MSEKYKVHYFDVRGRAEPIRMILCHVGAEWADQILNVSAFKQVPVLQIGENFLAQTHSICRYLGKKYKLNGLNDWESAKCDEVVDGTYDFAQLYNGAWDEKDAAKKKAMIDVATAKGREKYIKGFNDLLEANGGLLVSSKITWADIVVANAVDFAEKLWSVSVTKGYPALKSFIATVFALDGIRQWIERRPVSEL